LQQAAYYAAIGVTVLEGLNLVAFWVNKLAELAERRKGKSRDRRPILTGVDYGKLEGETEVVGA
jgi:hypothetical protein